MSYRVELTPPVARSVSRLRGVARIAVLGFVSSLGTDPRPPQARKLSGSDLWRLRVRIDGMPWRIVYQIRDEAQLVVVTRVARRNEATYRGL